jgi:hypothetical protein
MSEGKKQKMVEVVESALAGEFARAGGASANLPVAPDPEVRALAKRRQFNAAHKLAVLAEADRLRGAPRESAPS